MTKEELKRMREYCKRETDKLISGMTVVDFLPHIPNTCDQEFLDHIANLGHLEKL